MAPTTREAELEAEVSRLHTELSFAREDGSQQAQRADEFKKSITDEIAIQIFADLVASGGGNVAPDMAKKAFRAAETYLAIRQQFLK